jgi:hypothetical protein
MGLSFLLILVFGPIGLFYSSVIGGLVMCFGPLFVIGYALLTGSFDGLFLFAVAYAVLGYVICFIWGMVAVSNYNRRLYMNQHQYSVPTSTYPEYQSAYGKIEQQPQAITEGIINNNNSGKPSVAEWQKQNPGKGINDYFNHFGTN